MTDDEALRLGCEVVGAELDGSRWIFPDGTLLSEHSKARPAYVAELLVAMIVADGVFRIEHGKPKPGMVRAQIFSAPAAPGWLIRSEVIGADFAFTAIRAALVSLGHEAAGKVE